MSFQLLFCIIIAFVIRLPMYHTQHAAVIHTEFLKSFRRDADTRWPVVGPEIRISVTRNSIPSTCPDTTTILTCHSLDPHPLSRIIPYSLRQWMIP